MYKVRCKRCSAGAIPSYTQKEQCLTWASVGACLSFHRGSGEGNPTLAQVVLQLPFLGELHRHNGPKVALGLGRAGRYTPDRSVS